MLHKNFYIVRTLWEFLFFTFNTYGKFLIQYINIFMMSWWVEGLIVSASTQQ